MRDNKTHTAGGHWKDLNDLIQFSKSQEVVATNEVFDSWTAILDSRASLVYLSPFYFVLTGLAKKQIIGQNFIQTLPRDTPHRAKEALIYCIEKRQAIKHFRFKRIASNGEEIFISTSGTPQFDHRGDFIGYYAVSQKLNAFLDESIVRYALDPEAKHSLLKYEQVIQQTDQGYWYISPQGNTLEVNAALCGMFGYSKEEMRDITVFDLVDEENAQVFREELEKRKRGNAQPYQITLTHKDGKRVACINNPSRILDENGKHLGSVGLWTDVSQLMLLNKHLAAAKQEADTANSAKSSFLANMSHELRTPMNGVIGMADILALSNLQRSDSDMVEAIRQSGRSLLALLDGILDFSKIEAGKFALSIEPMSLEAVVDQVCNLLMPVALKKNVEILSFFDPSIPATLLGDDLRFRQVLTNIVGNAIKFSSSSERKGKVSLSAKLVDQDKDQAELEITVSDNGIGMDEATRERIFQPFEQADSATTRRFGGTGLGLVISQQLMTMMGGHISAKSTPQEGSTFLITCALTAPPRGKASCEPSAIDGVKCVLVNIPTAVRISYTTYLNAAGAHVDAVDSVETAYGLYSKTHESEDDVCFISLIESLDTSALDPGTNFCAATKTGEPKANHLYLVAKAQPHLEQTDQCIFTVGMLGLSRKRFLDAVAVVSGRSVPEPPRDRLQWSERQVRVPAIEQTSRQSSVVLVADDNEINQDVLQRQLALFGLQADIARNGREAFEKWESAEHALVFTDLHMPEWDGYDLTKAIRKSEQITGKAKTAIVAVTANALK
ncbi:MAG: PAS domain S-box protein, partial [Planctomycetaceae bacterium]|nr:PAS domain S-box protein [Planctomycetaceae bacterium]